MKNKYTRWSDGQYTISAEAGPSYQVGDHVVKTEGERRGGTIIEEGGEKKVKWGDGTVTQLDTHPIAPAKEHMS